MNIKNFKAQSEMVGFALIIILVAIILLIFLSLSFKNNDEKFIESSKASSFIQSSLYYTTSCADKGQTDYLSIRELIFQCTSNQLCYNSQNSCEVLNETFREILNSSWKTGQNYPTKGYTLNISSYGENLLFFQSGNKTNVAFGSSQIFENNLEIYFIVYE